MLEMDELLIFSVEGTAEWRRRMALKHPGDATRNLAAADLLMRLAQDLRSLEGTSLHQNLDAVLTSDSDAGSSQSEIISQATRGVGFSRFPKSGHEFLEELLRQLESENISSRQVNEPSSDQPPALRIVRTPRFPDGIPISRLRMQPIPVQKETMAFWFIEHYAPATGTYFGFSEAATTQPSAAFNTSPLNTFAFNQGPKIAGFGQGTFFNGGRAPELLKKTFETGVGPAPIEEVAAIFDGLWEMKQPQPSAQVITGAITDDMVVAALDDLTSNLQKDTQEHGGMGHNGPPDDEESLTPSERVIILRATQDAKMAVLSKDQSGIQSALDIFEPFVVKLGSGIISQVNNMFTKFTSTLGVGGALLTIGWFGEEIGIWNKAQAATWLLSHFAKSLAGG